MASRIVSRVPVRREVELRAVMGAALTRPKAARVHQNDVFGQQGLRSVLPYLSAICLMVEPGARALHGSCAYRSYAFRCGKGRSREIEGRGSRRMMTIIINWEVPVESSESGIRGAGHMVEVT